METEDDRKFRSEETLKDRLFKKAETKADQEFRINLFNKETGRLLNLQENDVIKAQASNANELHIIASILEINRD